MLRNISRTQNWLVIKYSNKYSCLCPRVFDFSILTKNWASFPCDFHLVTVASNLHLYSYLVTTIFSLIQFFILISIQRFDKLVRFWKLIVRVVHFQPKKLSQYWKFLRSWLCFNVKGILVSGFTVKHFSWRRMCWSKCHYYISAGLLINFVS